MAMNRNQILFGKRNDRILTIMMQRQQQSQTNLLSTSRFDRKSFINIERIDEEDGPNVTRTMIQTDLYRHRNHLENDNSSGDDKDEIISTNLDNQIQMRIDELNPTTESHSNGSTMIENLVQSNQSKDFDNDLDTVVGVSDENLLFVLQKQSPNSISDETKHENSIGEKNFEDNKNVSDDNHHHHHHHHRRKQPIINNYEERNNDSNDHNDNGRDKKKYKKKGNKTGSRRYRPTPDGLETEKKQMKTHHHFHFG
ncbi:hypothetical protein QR98_0025270 [Sarcoptes scabiei]|uniref:Uncharacterized protein n=1 Tax=Sarcoptes scabiei TaxID=52283 RepID=A0A131ZZJ9_SARSC|nr:hypothetical protein QR98_0025270 [Sarcoptes scabiei]